MTEKNKKKAALFTLNAAVMTLGLGVGTYFFATAGNDNPAPATMTENPPAASAHINDMWTDRTCGLICLAAATFSGLWLRRQTKKPELRPQ